MIKLNETQEKVWHNIADTILIFVRPPSSLSILALHLKSK